MKLARWRRDHQEEWSVDCMMPLDPDPQAWYAAFESWIGSIKAAYAAKRSNDPRVSMGTSTGEAPVSTTDVGEDQNVWPQIPGSYPSEYDKRQ